MMIGMWESIKDNRVSIGKVDKSLLRNIDVYNYYLEQQIRLCGYRHSKKTRCYDFSGSHMVLDKRILPSTTTENAQNHFFYSKFKILHLNIPKKKKVFDILPSRPLFKDLDSLTIELDSSNLTFWEDMFDLRA
jgi:hypothetical protein